MITLTAIVAVFGTGWMSRQVWKSLVSALATLTTPQRKSETA